MTVERTFDQMRKYATGSWEMSKALSFIQVEMGLEDLEACWDAFLDTSADYGEVFTDENDLYAKFTDALNDYAEYLEPFFNEVGSSFR